MKKLLLSMLLLLLLAGCSRSADTELVRFYYEAQTQDGFSETGCLDYEEYSLSEAEKNPEGLLAAYWKGPQSDRLVSPFPEELTLLSCETKDTGILLVVEDSFSAYSDFQKQLVMACLTKTLEEYGGFQTVTVKTKKEQEAGEPGLTMQQSRLILSDHSVGEESLPVVLYFADPNGRYLLESSYRIEAEDFNAIPAALIHALISGPSSGSLMPTMPEGTALLNIGVVDGVCIVDFSEEFIKNCPESELSRRLTLFSVVNTLTQLEQIHSVELLVEGSSIAEDFLLQPELTRDERLNGPVLTLAGEWDIDCYVNQSGTDRLTPFPLRLRRIQGQSKAQCVVAALGSFTPKNGYESPMEKEGLSAAVTQNGDTLQVTLSGTPTSPLVVESLAATLLKLPDIGHLVIFAEGEMLLDADAAQWQLSE